MSDKLTASVVGAGGGGHLSMSALAASERFELLAAADIDPGACAKLADEYPGIRTFPGHREMFAACATDVVCVSTWAPSHEPIVMAALAGGLKGILVEKPLADTAAGGRRLLEAIKARRVPMAVPHGMLAKKAPLEIIQRVRDGQIGELKLVEIQCTRWDIINAGIHWLNFFVNLIGDDAPESVLAICDAAARTYRDGMQVETEAVTFVQTRRGVRCVMQTGDDVKIARAGKGTLFRLVGTEGLIEFWGWENAYRILNAEFPRAAHVEPDEFPVTGHRRHLEAMAAMIGGEPDYAIPRTSLAALELCEAAYLSSRHRCKVALPLEHFTPAPASDWDPGLPYGGAGGGRDGRKLPT